MVALIALVVILGALVAWVIGLYNGLIRLRNVVKNSWSQIDVQLKRRHDLIPNLVETVKGYAGHEAGTLQAVTEARAKAVSADGPAEASKAEGELSSALGRLMVVVEQYPDLKANQNFLGLQEELTSTENKISFSRQHYNDSVMGQNTRVESFPSNIVANAFAFIRAPYFEVPEAETAPVKVDLR